MHFISKSVNFGRPATGQVSLNNRIKALQEIKSMNYTKVLFIYLSILPEYICKVDLVKNFQAYAVDHLVVLAIISTGQLLVGQQMQQRRHEILNTDIGQRLAQDVGIEKCVQNGQQRLIHH